MPSPLLDGRFSDAAKGQNAPDAAVVNDRQISARKISFGITAAGNES
jgi:hypothetical protein